MLIILILILILLIIKNSIFKAPRQAAEAQLGD